METRQVIETDLRREILDTTRRLLVSEGYKNLSMRKIARAIGYSATSIYLHFGGKDALFHALIEEGMERLYADLQAAERRDGDARQRLRILCRAYIDFGLQNPEYYEIMFMLHPEHMERFPSEKYRRARRNLDVVTTVLQEGAEDGYFQLVDARVAASAVWSMLHGTVSLLLARRVDVRIEAETLVETVVEQVVRGVLSENRLTT